MTPQQAIERVIALEGGYTLHQNQGESTVTYAGIYRKAHPNWQGWEYIDRQQTPPEEMVRDFYLSRFYQPLQAITDPQKRYVIFEYAVSTGLSDAIKTAQSVVKVSADGVLGKISTAAINNMDSKLFFYAYTLARTQEYLRLANNNPSKYSVFLRGWLNRTFATFNNLGV